MIFVEITIKSIDMMRSLFFLLLVMFLSIDSVRAQTSFSIDGQDTFGISSGIFIEQMQPPGHISFLRIKNETQSDIELKVRILESRVTDSDLAGGFLVSHSHGLHVEVGYELNNTMTIQPGLDAFLDYESFLFQDPDLTPQEHYMKVEIFNVADTTDRKELVFISALGDLTPGTGYNTDDSQVSQTFTPNIFDWNNNIEINNNGNGTQTFTLTNPNSDDVKIGWELESVTYPDEWEIFNITTLDGVSGHLNFNAEDGLKGQFWAWANGSYTFNNFSARIKHNRVPGSAVMRFKIYDLNDSLSYNDHFELSYHLCHPEAATEEVITDRSQAVLCPGEPLTLTANASYSDVNWSTGEVSNSITTMVEGDISLIAKNEIGCTVVDTLELEVIRPYEEEICLIDVNPASYNNIISWYATEDAYTSRYQLYKQTTQAGDFEQVYGEDFDGVHMYTDVDSDARVGSERYQLRTTDICDNESDGSTSHKTLHLTSNRGINGEINLIWEKYEGLEYTTFRILKGSSLDNMLLIAERPSNTFTFTDLNPNLAENFYRVEIDVELFCDANVPIPSTPGSNIIYYQLSTNTSEIASDNVVLSPNPVSDYVQLANVVGYKDYIIYSDLGQVISQGKIDSGQISINLSDIPTGMYFIRLSGDQDIYKTFIKE